MRTIDELLDGVSARHADLAELAGTAEDLGTAPPELVAILADLREPLVKAPVEVGGDRIGLADQLRYFEALSHANATAGWIGFNHAGAAGMTAAILPDAGNELLFGGGKVPFIAAVAAPTGSFEFVDGGIELTGTYDYASGVSHSEWIMLPAVEVADQPQVRMSLVRAADVEITGSWDVMALKGTGSLSASPSRVFVPTELTADPFAGPLRGGPMYCLGYQAYVSGENLGFTIGVCQRFIDEMGRYAVRKSRGSDGRLADRGAFQYELGKAQLQVDAARAHGLQTLGQAETRLASAGELTEGQQQDVTAMTAFATESAVNAISHLFHFAGAGALFNSNVLQRLFRDAHGSAQHHVASNVAYDRLGGRLLAHAEPAPSAQDPGQG